MTDRASLDSSTWSVELGRVPLLEWSDLLDRFELANYYLLWGMGALRYSRRSLTHVVTKRDGRVAAIAQGARWRIPGLRAGVAHFYWSPLWKQLGEEPDPEALVQTLRAMHTQYVLRQGLLVRIRAYEPESEGQPGATSVLFEQEGFRRSAVPFFRSMRLDLSPSLEELRGKLKPSWRRHLRAAERQDFHISRGNSRELFQKFVLLFRQMQRRKDLGNYDPDVEGICELQSELPQSEKFEVFVCSLADEPVAANVVHAAGSAGIYAFGATSDRAVRENLRGSYLLHWSTIEWLKSRGFRWYDLRGYDPQKYPGVSRFKAGLNGEIVCYPEFVACRNPLSRFALGAGTGARRLARAARWRVRQGAWALGRPLRRDAGPP
jgi:hypothetical protein